MTKQHEDQEHDSAGVLISSDGDGEQSVLAVLTSTRFRQRAFGTLILIALLVGGALFWSNVRATETSPQVPDIALEQATPHQSPSRTPSRNTSSSESATAVEPETEVSPTPDGGTVAPTSAATPSGYAQPNGEYQEPNSTYSEPGRQRRNNTPTTPETSTPTTTSPQNILQDWWDSLGRGNRQATPSSQVPTATPTR